MTSIIKYYAWFYIGKQLICEPVYVMEEFRSKAGQLCVKCMTLGYKYFACRKKQLITKTEMRKRKGIVLMKRPNIVLNKIRCNHCHDEIESANTYDFKWCTCNTVAVDGGKEYLKRLFKNDHMDYEDLSETIPH